MSDVSLQQIDHLPRYWQQLLALESRLGTMKSKPLPEIAGA